MCPVAALCHNPRARLPAGPAQPRPRLLRAARARASLSFSCYFFLSDTLSHRVLSESSFGLVYLVSRKYGLAVCLLHTVCPAAHHCSVDTLLRPNRCQHKQVINTTTGGREKGELHARDPLLGVFLANCSQSNPPPPPLTTPFHLNRLNQCVSL